MCISKMESSDYCKQAERVAYTQFAELLDRQSKKPNESSVYMSEYPNF